MNKKSTEFYNDFADKQVERGIHHRHLAIQRSLEELNMPQIGNFLEIGCGIGTQTQLLLQFLKLEAQLTAVDISDKSIAFAKQRLKKYTNLNLVVGDITTLNIEGKYDAIILPDVIEHIPLNQHDNLFKKLSSILDDHGFIFIHIPHPNYLEWITKNRPHELQVIDNPVYTNDLLSHVYKHNLYLDYMKSYSIFNKPEDYQILSLRKRTIESYTSIDRLRNDSYYRRAKRKLKRIIRGK